MQKEHKKQSVFISYNWGDGNYYAEELEKQLKYEFDVFRDKSRLAVNDDIEDFMRGIADCDIVVLVLTSDYSKSENCMKELVYLVEQPDWKEKSMLLVIDSDLYGIETREEIVDYWENEYDKAKKALDQKKRKHLSRINQVESLKNICDHLEVFFEQLKRRNNPSQIAIVNEIYKRAKRDRTQEMKDISSGELEVKNALEKCGNMTISELSETINKNKAVVSRYISRLSKNGIVYSDGSSKRVKWSVAETSNLGKKKDY